MTAYDSPILALAAFLVLVVLIRFVLKNYKQLSVVALVLVGGGAALVAVLGVVVLSGVWFYDQYTEKQCLTAHERLAKAAAAPDDYFGRKLREEAAEEATKCADLAKRREAAAQK